MSDAAFYLLDNRLGVTSIALLGLSHDVAMSDSGRAIVRHFDRYLLTGFIMSAVLANVTEV